MNTTSIRQTAIAIKPVDERDKRFPAVKLPPTRIALQRIGALSFATLCLSTALRAQSSTPIDTKAWTTQDDHRNMMKQLSITALRESQDSSCYWQVRTTWGRDPGRREGRGHHGGLQALLDICRRKAPNATIIFTGIFPRNDNVAVMPEINRLNENIARMADGRHVRYLNVNDKLADANGVLFEGMTMDKLHPTVQGYQVWADALKPIFTELLGPPAATDQAPPRQEIPVRGGRNAGVHASSPPR